MGRISVKIPNDISLTSRSGTGLGLVSCLYLQYLKTGGISGGTCGGKMPYTHRVVTFTDG